MKAGSTVDFFWDHYSCNFMFIINFYIHLVDILLDISLQIAIKFSITNGNDSGKPSFTMTVLLLSQYNKRLRFHQRR